MVEPVAADLPVDMTVETFFAWAQGRPGRHELEFGRVISMAPESLGHTRAKTGIQNVLAAAIARSHLPCEAVGDGATVRIDSKTAYEPDALVYCGSILPPSAIEVPEPVVVVEVVSPSSVSRDHNDKLVGYFMLPSVRHYLIVNPDRRTLVHHAREEDAIRTRILGSGALRLDPPGLDLAVEDLFGVGIEAGNGE